MENHNNLFKVKVMVVNSKTIDNVKYVYKGSNFLSCFAKRYLFKITIIVCIVTNILLILSMVAPL